MEHTTKNRAFVIAVTGKFPFPAAVFVNATGVPFLWDEFNGKILEPLTLHRVTQGKEEAHK